MRKVSAPRNKGDSFTMAAMAIASAAAIAILFIWLTRFEYHVEKFVGDPTVKFVYVYSPNCKYCDAFNREWDKFTREVKESTLKDITVSTEKTVDATKYNVNAFPTILVFVSGKQVDKIEGKRSTTDLWDLLRKNMHSVIQ
jgi:thioredoxin-like negative regulator of GroEL